MSSSRSEANIWLTPPRYLASSSRMFQIGNWNVGGGQYITVESNGTVFPGNDPALMALKHIETTQSSARLKLAAQSHMSFSVSSPDSYFSGSSWIFLQTLSCRELPNLMLL